MDDANLYLHPLQQEMYNVLAKAGFDDSEDRPKLFIDGRRVNLETEIGALKGTAARLNSTNDKTFPDIAGRLDVEHLSIGEMRGADLSALANCKRLTHLHINWATKLSDLTVLRTFGALTFLEIEDAPKIESIEPIGALTNLRWLCYRGGIWNANHVDTLEHIAGLSNLEALVLHNFKVNEGGLKPLAVLKSLRFLALSNQFETEDYAYLSIQLPETQCAQFAAYQQGNDSTYGDIMVTGKRKPFLKSHDPKDQGRLEKYVTDFKKLQDRFRSI
ncbi:MAG: leucine-rich repeat domain-containing protein [Parasphingorhabdus sp.]